MNDILIPRCISPEGKGLIIKSCIDSTSTVINSNGEIVQPEQHNGMDYLPCNVGDAIVVYYENKKYSRNFKIVGIDKSEQFFICNNVLSFEENIELQLKEIANMVKENKLTTNEAHLKADELIVSLLYKKGYDRIADAFVSVPKYYE